MQAELQRRNEAEAMLRTELTTLKTVPKKRTMWLGQIPALITALVAVGGLIYTGQSLNASNRNAAVQNQLAESGQITDRFNAAVTNLGSAALDIRLGGIYALERIMKDSPQDQPTIVSVLSAYIRDHAAANRGSPSVPTASSAPEPPQSDAIPLPPADLAAALTVLGRRDRQEDGASSEELRGIDLSGLDLSGIDFSGSDLSAVNLSGANLSDQTSSGPVSSFGGYTPPRARLDGADLDGARMENTDLTGVSLSRASMLNADLSGASLAGADLSYADLSGANISETDLLSTNLSYATFFSTDFTGIYFINTNLNGADLTGANMKDVHFSNVDTRGAKGLPSPLPTGLP